MANEIVTEIVLELDKLKDKLKEAEKLGATSGQKMGEAFGTKAESAFSSGFGGLKTKILGLAVAVAGAFSAKEAIQAAAEQQNAVNSLNSALAITGAFTDQASQRFQNYASSLQNVTTVADEVIVQGGALLVTMGKLSGEGLERATKAALDLAAGLNIDVNSAFNMVAKAASGNVGMLSRYGIEVLKTADESRNFADALAKINERFGGLAESKVNTFTGSLERMKNAFGEVLEEIGNMIVKSPTVVAIINALSASFLKIANSIQVLAAGRDIFGDLAKAGAEFGRALLTYVVAPLEFMYNIATTVFNGLRTLIQGQIVFILGGASLITGALAGISDRFAAMNDTVVGMRDTAISTLKDFAAETATSTENLFNFDATVEAEKYLTNFQVFLDTVKPVTTEGYASIAADANAAMQPHLVSGWTFITNGFQAAFSRVVLTGETFRTQLQGKLNSAFTSFRDGVAGSFASIGSALVKGENAFAAFGKALLGVFGDLAIQIGTFYFLLGLSNLFLNPGAAAAEIAGGIALIALGGALKALSGGGGGGGGAAAGAGGGGGGGGGVAVGVGGLPPSTDQGQTFQETERKDVGTKIEVNVDGNILDRRQTGLELVEVMNEAFGSQGLALATSGST